MCTRAHLAGVAKTEDLHEKPGHSSCDKLKPQGAVPVNRTEKYDCLLFDIGGVLFEVCSAPKILEWMDNKVSNEEINNIWLFSKAVRSYESGLISSEVFAESVIEELKLSVSAEKFLEEFVGFIKGPYPGVEELLKNLSRKYTVACLSNTNELHWKRLCDDFNFDKMIKRSFLSFKTGFMKPDPEAYRHVISEMACEPSRILFFDDNRVNVEAARRAGMDAFHVSGFADVKRKLLDIGIIN